MGRLNSTRLPSPLSVQVFNRQKTRPINISLLRQITQSLADILPAGPGQEHISGERTRPRVQQAAPPRPASPEPPHFSVPGQLAIHLINASEMARLNEEFLSHAGSTDVITFNYEEDKTADRLCGEIFISVDDAVAAAPRFGVGWPLELTRYVAHGLLHLRGFDDRAPATRREMKKWENRLLKELSCRVDCAKLEGRKNVARRK